MSGFFYLRTDSCAVSKARHIQIRPDHALEECEQRLIDFHRSRGIVPAMLVLGFETYHNLCIDLERRASGKDRLINPGMVPRVNEFRKIPICVNDEECWGVHFCPPIEKAWPQYGKDDWVDRWRPEDVAKDPSPDTPPIRAD